MKFLKDAENSKNWHFHMLGRQCLFNKAKEKYAIVFENKKTQIELFDEKPLLEAKTLADLMYGKRFYEEKGGAHNNDADLIFKRALELNKKGIEWHHHHLYPGCTFSKDKKKHWIILEDPFTKKVMAASYKDKPKGDLAKIEKLFYANLR